MVVVTCGECGRGGMRSTYPPRTRRMHADGTRTGLSLGAGCDEQNSSKLAAAARRHRASMVAEATQGGLSGEQQQQEEQNASVGVVVG